MFERTKDQGSERPEYPKSKNLLANAREPPADIPVTVAEDVHVPLDVPEAERSEAPFAVGVFPVSAVRLLVGEGVVGFVDDRDGVRVSGFETAEFIFLV